MANRFEMAKAYTKQYKSILIPCGVCGNSDVRVVSDRDMFPPRNTWSVCCSTPNCDCTRTYEKVKDAVIAWNITQKRRLNHERTDD